MLKVIAYAYMNSICSFRKTERLLHRDVHFIWLSGYEKPDFITINRFRDRVKEEINDMLPRTVLLLSAKGFVSLDVEYVDGTKIESKANTYTFVWRRTVERNRAKLTERTRALLGQVDDATAQDKRGVDERPRHVQGPFRSENFYHNEKEDCCVCPTGRRMERTGQRNVKTASGHLPERHRCQSRNCDGCPLRPLCFNAAGNRTVERNRRLEKYRRQAFDLLASEEGLRQRGRRCVEPEAVLGQMKSHMAYRRFRHFGKDKVTMGFSFFAMAFNLKKMVAKMKPGGFKRHLDCMNFIFHLVVRNVSHPGTFDKQKQIKLAA